MTFPRGEAFPKGSSGEPQSTGLRIGVGYDSHPFAEGRPLLLGGVEIPHELGLAGHSDADVLTHAIIDAVLGAAGQGDLGGMFPPGDESWRGADSLEMLRVALGSIGGRVLNVDATVVCESPRLGEHREAIQHSLAEVLSAPVSVKASTNEGMGWIGRGEGIACIAVALLES